MIFLYLDQNYLSGIAKRKLGFVELDKVLSAAVSRGAVAVPETAAHAVESAPRPDLGLLELLHRLSRGRRLEGREPVLERKLLRTIERGFPSRQGRPSDQVDVAVLALALPRCRLVTCDAFMADVVARSGLDVRFRCELYTGRRRDVERLTARLAGL